MPDRYKRLLLIFFILLVFSIPAETIYAQERLITGRVTAAVDGTPMPGVNIRIRDSSTGTISDQEGQYRILVPHTDSVLVYSYIGFKTVERIISGPDVVDVALEEDVAELESVVVTALGIRNEKARLGYAVQEVEGENLVKAREPNPINALTGKVAGLTIGASSELMGSPSISLRGSNPIVVIDGVPINSDTWNINPDDIESYTVLKGPSAAALYGFRSKDGVIMITTKKGSRDRRGYSVEFNSSLMAESGFNAIPNVQDEYGPGDHGRYAFVDGKGGGLNDGDYDIWGPKFEGQLIPQYDSPIDPETGERIPTPWLARGKDNLERFLQTGALSTNSLSIASSSDRYDLRFSGTYQYQQGIVPNTHLNGLNFNVYSGYNFSSKTRIDANMNYSRQFTDNVPDVNYGPTALYTISSCGVAPTTISTTCGTTGRRKKKASSRFTGNTSGTTIPGSCRWSGSGDTTKPTCTAIPV